MRLVEELVKHSFRDRSLLEQSLTHSSYLNEMPLGDLGVLLPDNERLEFLGDAVIGLIVGRALMEQFPQATEGKLSRWRSSLVSRKTLAEMAGTLGMGDLMFLGRGERRTGGSEKKSILAGVFESIVGALYLDAGIEKVSEFLVRVYQPWFETLTNGDERATKLFDKKTHLQEQVQQKYRTTPVYRVVRAWGAEHEKNFCVEILVEGRIVSTGEGKSKKEAEQHAASEALQVLDF